MLILWFNSIFQMAVKIGPSVALYICQVVHYIISKVIRFDIAIIKTIYLFIYRIKIH